MTVVHTSRLATALWGEKRETMTVDKLLIAMRRGDVLIESPFARLLGKTAYITSADIELLLKDHVLELDDVIDLDVRC